jgi:hypothetical protein
MVFFSHFSKCVAFDFASHVGFSVHLLQVQISCLCGYLSPLIFTVYRHRVVLCCISLNTHYIRKVLNIESCIVDLNSDFFVMYRLLMVINY